MLLHRIHRPQGAKRGTLWVGGRRDVEINKFNGSVDGDDWVSVGLGFGGWVWALETEFGWPIYHSVALHR